MDRTGPGTKAPLIRAAAPEDAAGIRDVNVAAFGRPDEADLTERLRTRREVFELVAAESERGEVVGHILFSPVALAGSACRAPSPPGAGRGAASGPGGARRSYGLGPMAVLPAHQRGGLGSRLVEAGLDACRRRDAQLVVVLGHPEFYPRFGFEPATRLGLRCKWPVPDEAFMALALTDAARDAAARRVAAGPPTLVHYLPDFDTA